MVSASGTPMSGLDIASLEATDHTDASGAFSVRYKDPSRHVHFGRGSVWYQREYRPEDEGAVVVLALPPLRDVALQCGPVPCVAEMVWELGHGFRARATQACEPGLVAQLKQIPADTPSITCTEGSGGPQVPISLEDRGNALAIGPARSPLRVEIRSVDGGAPTECVVSIGDRLARPAGDGFWSAETSGIVTVSATCDGIPARPRQVHVEVGSVALEWTREGPTVDLEDVAPWLTTLVIVSESGEGSGWVTEIRESRDGTFSLPPLSEGRYRILGSSQPDASLLAIQPPVPSGPGILTIYVDGSLELLVGRLDVSTAILAGTIGVDQP